MSRFPEFKPPEIDLTYLYENDFDELNETVELNNYDPDNLRKVASQIETYADAVRFFAYELEKSRENDVSDRKYEIYATTYAEGSPRKTVNVECNGQYDIETAQRKLRYMNAKVAPKNGYTYFIKEVK